MNKETNKDKLSNLIDKSNVQKLTFVELVKARYLAREEGLTELADIIHKQVTARTPKQ